MRVDLWHYGSKERLENGCLGGSGEQGAVQGAVGHLILYQNEEIGTACQHDFNMSTSTTLRFVRLSQLPTATINLKSTVF